MRKPILIGSVVMVLAAAVLAGNEPWKAKPYQQWDEKDVRKILGDSPWSKVIQVEANWKNSKDIANGNPAQQTPTGAPATSGKMGTPATGTPAGGSPAGSTPAAGAPGPGDASPQVAFVVRWVSSRTLQRAAARSAELAGQLKPEDAEKQLANQPDVYEVAVSGPDMRPFQSADEDTLKKSAVLVEKKTKQKISPTKVQVSRSADGTKVQAVAFIFPKKSDNGEPNIPEDEKGVDFNYDLSGAKIRASFDISKMQDNQGRDL
jgi:hypothetical protein